MEEAMIHTEHSLLGSGDEHRLSEFPEDTNWQGLVQLYRVNESLLDYRHDYSVSLEDWDNFAKDVDKMFAQLSNLKKLNQSKPQAELGSGIGAMEEGSGVGGDYQQVLHSWVMMGPQTTTPETPLIPITPLTSGNNLPERLPTKLPIGASANKDLWTNNMLHELDHDEINFSGNGLTELEVHHDFLFGSSMEDLDLSKGQRRFKQEEDMEEDIFEAQGYMRFTPQSARPPSQSEKTPPSQSPHQTLNTLHPQTHHDPQDFDGSGLDPPHLKKIFKNSSKTLTEGTLSLA